jgi:hypothetical protein
MARIPEVEIKRLKREISLQRLVGSAGVALTRHGADLHGLCPFHEGVGPSLVISPAKNLWHCLGACQTGGSVIDWVMKTQGVSFRHAVELLREGLPLAAGARPVKDSTVRQLSPPVAPDADDQRLLNQVIRAHHGSLQTLPVRRCGGGTIRSRSAMTRPTGTPIPRVRRSICRYDYRANTSTGKRTWPTTTSGITIPASVGTWKATPLASRLESIPTPMSGEIRSASWTRKV